MEPDPKSEDEGEPGLPKRRIFHGARLTKKEKDEIQKIDSKDCGT